MADQDKVTSNRRLLIGKGLLLAVLLVAGMFASGVLPVPALKAATAMPAAIVDEHRTSSHTPETAVLAGGCFWGVQGVFQHVTGVTSAVAGYSGGDQATARYETVSMGNTGHAESVQITYDPSVITFGQLLQIYFSVVTDPTTLNRQGPDRGTQYRSAVFFQNQQQKKIAEDYIAQLNKAAVFDQPIVTALEPFKAFYPAEAYHQDYLALNPHYPYIALNDMPKVDHLKQLFPMEYRADPVLVSAH